MYLIDKVDKEMVKEMTPEEVNIHFDQLIYKDTTEQKRQRLLQYLDVEEANADGANSTLNGVELN